MNNALNLLEAHVEKIVLGAAALFTLWLAWGYLLGSPNRISFEGKLLAPGQLDTAILASAQSLESAVRTAKPNQEPIPDFSRQVADLHRSGIFAPAAPDAPRLAAELPRMAPFSTTAIQVEGLVEEEKDNVRLVTPLPPTRPLARTGRSKASHIPIRIGVDQPLSAAAAGPAADASEVAWVSVGAYFDTLAQRNAMIDADYAASRARAYVATVDVQRQEVLADGSYSEWKDVRSTAMPELDIVQPIFEDGTGALTNKEEIDRMFAAIKAEQKTTMQPPFMRVQVGDFWEPPLEGLDFDEGDEVAEERPKPKPEPTRPVTPPRPPPGGGGRIPGGDVVGGDTVRGGGGGGGGG
ncbi:MAG: hypothetical protein HUU27_13355, partial [Phycisphaerae bacterium]|nr:hypothetical protein [Phycisphaerae bacterium]